MLITGARKNEFSLPFWQTRPIFVGVTLEIFHQEMADALKAYEKFVISIDKTPEDFQASLISLMTKAIRAYESRGPQLRHGIALDKHITVILSQNDGSKPLCGIYFNLHSPYQKQAPARAVQPLGEPITEAPQNLEN
jgi:hypothetical protein